MNAGWKLDANTDATGVFVGTGTAASSKNAAGLATAMSAVQWSQLPGTM